MRFVLKSLFAGLSGFSTVLMLALSFAPATAGELSALGPDHDRMDRVQMRLAKVAMTVAPDLAVTQMAQAANLPEDFVRQQLLATAEGRVAHDMIAQHQTASVDTDRRLTDGGALFVQAN